MKNNLIIAGATGLIGNILIDILCKKNPFDRVIILSRKEIRKVKCAENIEYHIINFNRLEDHKELFNAKTFINTLGTTIKKAGSQEEFFHVDYQIPKRIAELCSVNGLENIIMVSSIGADPDSKIFYSSVKGQLERDLSSMRLKSIHILRPSLLLGKRAEFRLSEKAVKLFVPLLSVFLPKKYRPIQARIVAEKIFYLAVNPGEGMHIYKGEDLY